MSLILSGTDGLSDVDGSASTPAIRGTDTNTGIFFPSADTIAFAEGGVEVARFDVNSNFGLGTTSPTPYNSGAKVLQVNSGVANSEFKLTNSTTGNSASVGLNLIQSGNDTYIYNASNSFMAFGTNNAERMRINSSGNVLVGTTTVYASTNVFQVNVDAISSGGGAWVSKCAGTDTVFHLNFQNGNGGVGGISTSGTSTQYVTSSDYRLKENIAPMVGALATVQLLKPITYKWKVDGSDGQGFIAHELAEVVPDCVVGEKDGVDKDGNPKYQGIDTSFLVATLTAAIQEQQAIITDLKSRIEMLEAKK
jgi:hypothetical protein